MMYTCNGAVRAGITEFSTWTNCLIINVFQWWGNEDLYYRLFLLQLSEFGCSSCFPLYCWFCHALYIIRSFGFFPFSEAVQKSCWCIWGLWHRVWGHYTSMVSLPLVPVTESEWLKKKCYEHGGCKVISCLLIDISVFLYAMHEQVLQDILLGFFFSLCFCLYLNFACLYVYHRAFLFFVCLSVCQSCCSLSLSLSLTVWVSVPVSPSLFDKVCRSVLSFVFIY